MLILISIPGRPGRPEGPGRPVNPISPFNPKSLDVHNYVKLTGTCT